MIYIYMPSRNLMMSHLWLQAIEHEQTMVSIRILNLFWTYWFNKNNRVIILLSRAHHSLTYSVAGNNAKLKEFNATVAIRIWGNPLIFSSSTSDYILSRQTTTQSSTICSFSSKEPKEITKTKNRPMKPLQMNLSSAAIAAIVLIVLAGGMCNTHELYKNSECDRNR